MSLRAELLRLALGATFKRRDDAVPHKPRPDVIRTLRRRLLEDFEPIGMGRERGKSGVAAA